MLDLATTMTNSRSWHPTFLPSFIVMRYVYDPGTDAHFGQAATPPLLFPWLD